MKLTLINLVYITTWPDPPLSNGRRFIPSKRPRTSRLVVLAASGATWTLTQGRTEKTHKDRKHGEKVPFEFSDVTRLNFIRSTRRRGKIHFYQQTRFPCERERVKHIPERVTFDSSLFLPLRLPRSSAVKTETKNVTSLNNSIRFF